MLCLPFRNHVKPPASIRLQSIGSRVLADMEIFELAM
jgi:hypothetical protein